MLRIVLALVIPPSKHIITYCAMPADCCTLYTLQCTLHAVQYTLHAVKYTLHAVQCTLYNANFTFFIAYFQLLDSIYYDHTLNSFAFYSSNLYSTETKTKQLSSLFVF